VDLMRRASGRRICQPGAVSGDLVAARARAHYAGTRDPAVTGSVAPRRLASPPRRISPTAYSDDRSDRDLPIAEPGNDGQY